MERYRVNEPSVIHQTIGGETVIIHLEHGLYYSLDETGAVIWEELASGMTPDQVVDGLAARHAAARADVAGAVGSLVERLCAEELMVPVAGPAPSAIADPGRVDDRVDPAARDPGGSDPARPFQPPTLERFDDLRELLLLDPIHAVPETGWPDRLETA